MNNKVEKYLKIENTDADFLSKIQFWGVKCNVFRVPFVLVMPQESGTFKVEWQQDRHLKDQQKLISQHRSALTNSFRALKEKYNSPAPANASMCTLLGLSEKDAEVAAEEVYDAVESILKEKNQKK